MIDMVTKAGVILLGVPIIGQAATQDWGIWSDYKTWIGAVALIVFTQGDKIITALRARWERRSLSDEQMKAREVERNITETERLQAKVDELVKSQIAYIESENIRLRQELAQAQLEKERYRDLFLTKGEQDRP